MKIDSWPTDDRLHRNAYYLELSRPAFDGNSGFDAFGSTDYK